MTTQQHHFLCLGVLAKLYIEAKDRHSFTDLSGMDMQAIEEAVESAEKLGLPVRLENLRAGLPLCTGVTSSLPK